MHTFQFSVDLVPDNSGRWSPHDLQDLSPALFEAFYQACVDGLLSTHPTTSNRTAYVEFTRTAKSYEEAWQSAVTDLAQVGLKGVRIRRLPALVAVAVLSDLHLERASSLSACESFGLDRPIEPAGPEDHARRVALCRSPLVAQLAGVEVLLLAGDIHTEGHAGWWALAFAEAWPNLDVAFIAGNHDYWHAAPDDVEDRLRGDGPDGWRRWASNEAAEATTTTTDTARLLPTPDTKRAGQRVHYLQNDTVSLRGLTIFGSTLWFPSSEKTDFAAARECWADFRFVEFPDYTAGGWASFGRCDGQDYRAAAHWIYRQNETAVEALRGALESVDPPQVILTHHLPSLSCVHPRWLPLNMDDADTLNDFFVGGDEDLVQEAQERSAQLWAFGHTHDSVSIQQDTLRLLANPRGYAPPTTRIAGEFECVNESFDPAGRSCTIKAALPEDEARTIQLHEARTTQPDEAP